MTDNPFRERAIQMMRDLAARKRDEPVILATGEKTWVYLDAKGVLTTRWRINLAADAMVHHILQFKPTAIGGPTMGADVLSHAVVSRCWQNEGLAWFAVRGKPKTTHGLGLWIEGYRLGPSDRVILTDDVANSGKSLVEAYERVAITGAKVVAIAPFVDRSGLTQGWLEELSLDGIPYVPLMDYTDLGLEPLKPREAIA